MYGENAAQLREALAELLRQHRIQQRIGGPGSAYIPVTTTPTEREQIGGLIRTYRYGVLSWCRQGLHSATGTHSSRANDPAFTLRRCLTRTLQATPGQLPTLEELTATQQFELVERWRHAAKAAALGEHDFAGELTLGRLDVDQRTQLASDVADVLRGLVVLDARYSNIPGWQPLRRTKALSDAATNCVLDNSSSASLDARGWRPPATTITGPARAGLGGVVQAQHNLLAHLNRTPTALNLRRILSAQQALSLRLAALTKQAAPDFSGTCRARATTYQLLGREARGIGGLLGSGGSAAAEAGNALSRLQHLPSTTVVSGRAQRDLARLFHGTDAAIAAHISHGTRDGLYLARAKVPRLVADDGRVVHGVRERFTPISTAAHDGLATLAKQRLNTTPTQLARGDSGRAALREALEHRPIPRSHGIGQ